MVYGTQISIVTGANLNQHSHHRGAHIEGIQEFSPIQVFEPHDFVIGDHPNETTVEVHIRQTINQMSCSTDELYPIRQTLESPMLLKNPLISRKCVFPTTCRD
jgi:hypothetical protein